MVFQELVEINQLRNRIAHFEPVSFDGNLISTKLAIKRYKSMLKLLEWLNFSPSQNLARIDKVQFTLRMADDIRNQIYF